MPFNGFVLLCFPPTCITWVRARQCCLPVKKLKQVPLRSGRHTVEAARLLTGQMSMLEGKACTCKGRQAQLLVNACMLTAAWLRGRAICTCSGLQDDGLEGIMPMPKGPDQREPIGGGCLHGEADGLRPCEIGVRIICEPCSTFHHVPSAHGSSTSELPACMIHKVACMACQFGRLLPAFRVTFTSQSLPALHWDIVHLRMGAKNCMQHGCCRRMLHDGWGQALPAQPGVGRGPLPCKHWRPAGSSIAANVGRNVPLLLMCTPSCGLMSGWVQWRLQLHLETGCVLHTVEERCLRGSVLDAICSCV